jgi:DNA-binding NarL/FixJ family response regulator
MIIQAQDDLKVVGEAANGSEAVELVATAQPEVALMDIRMPELDGIEATRRIVQSGSATRVLVLTTYGLEENVYDALRAGASGFLLKTDSPDRLVDAIRTVASGEALLAPEVTRRLIDRFVSSKRPGNPPPELANLTTRELDVLKLVARGRSNMEIAAELYVSAGTVKTHVGRLLAKLDLRDRTQAVVYAYENHIVQAGDADASPR